MCKCDGLSQIGINRRLTIAHITIIRQCDRFGSTQEAENTIGGGNIILNRFQTGISNGSSGRTINVDAAVIVIGETVFYGCGIATQNLQAVTHNSVTLTVEEDTVDGVKQV